jgi:hypothetical protein
MDRTEEDIQKEIERLQDKVASFLQEVFGDACYESCCASVDWWQVCYAPDMEELWRDFYNESLIEKIVRNQWDETQRPYDEVIRNLKLLNFLKQAKNIRLEGIVDRKMQSLSLSDAERDRLYNDLLNRLEAERRNKRKEFLKAVSNYGFKQIVRSLEWWPDNRNICAILAAGRLDIDSRSIKTHSVRIFVTRHIRAGVESDDASELLGLYDTSKVGDLMLKAQARRVEASASQKSYYASLLQHDALEKLEPGNIAEHSDLTYLGKLFDEWNSLLEDCSVSYGNRMFSKSQSARFAFCYDLADCYGLVGDSYGVTRSQKREFVRYRLDAFQRLEYTLHKLGI